MKVILTRDVPNVGKDGEVVTVADGYARNYLFPRQLPIVAKGTAMKNHSARIAREAAKGAPSLSAAQQAAEKLRGLQFQIVGRAAPKSTRLFGSVTEADVAAKIQDETGVIVDKRRISLIDPIKVTGIFELTARLHADVTVPFSIEVVTPEQLEARERPKSPPKRRPRKRPSASPPSKPPSALRTKRPPQPRRAATPMPGTIPSPPQSDSTERTPSPFPSE